jgi:hypothetical protein
VWLYHLISNQVIGFFLIVYIIQWARLLDDSRKTEKNYREFPTDPWNDLAGGGTGPADTLIEQGGGTLGEPIDLGQVINPGQFRMGLRG